jgi:L-threonylcarbamoyladenylate synthase
MILPQHLESYSAAASVIASGGVIAFRTDTFYGLGADPFNPDAVRRVRQLKGREGNKPILILVGDSDQVSRLIAVRSKAFDLLAERFWPGPLTLIGPARPEVPNEITAGTGTVGVRLADDDEVRALVRACGGALTATSANPSGDPPSGTAREVADYLHDGIDLIVDGGEVSATSPSTVVDLSDAEPRVVREGAISRADIMHVLEAREILLTDSP